MATTQPPPKIFLSYAWANIATADEIDNDFKAVGITFQRDVRDIAFAGSIKDFMNKIGKSDFVVMLISDAYIRSENCMYEVTELLGAHEFEKRILPVIVGNAPVFKRDDHRAYYQHWQAELKKAADMHTEFGNEKTLADKKKIQNIHDYLGIFFTKISDLRSETFEQLKKKNYKPILSKMGYEGEAVLEKILEIQKITDIEEQEIAFEELEKKYPDNRAILFNKAFQANENKQYKKAKKYYVDILRKYPQEAWAHFNYALLLEDPFNEFERAKGHYEVALSLNTQDSDAHISYALLLKNNLNDYKGAKEHYEAASKINPQDSNLYNNYAVLLTDHLNDHEGAKKHYETALMINPKYAEAHYNYALILKNNFNDYEGAKKHYEEALAINPQFALANNNYANLLRFHFFDYKKAKKHYEAALRANPQHVNALNNYAALLEEHFQDYQLARKHYEKALEINPDNEIAKTNLANLIKNHFS